jgi:hypothetical protein
MTIIARIVTSTTVDQAGATSRHLRRSYAARPAFFRRHVGLPPRRLHFHAEPPSSLRPSTWKSLRQPLREVWLDILKQQGDPMKRMVVDKNMLEDEELRAWLAESKDHIAIITDYAKLEMLKGNALKNILMSTEILAAFPKQVRMLKQIDAVSGLRGKKKGLKKRYTDGRNTVAFRKWCKTRERVKQGDKKLEAKILRWGGQAEAQFADMLENMKGFADNIDDATAEFTAAELAIVRGHEPYTDDMVLKIMDGTMKLAWKWTAMHIYFFRMALCAYLHALHWRAEGGAVGALSETMRQDVVDMTYAAYALCFDGLYTKDKLPEDIYRDAKPLLQLFVKDAPKRPRRRG